MQIAQVMAGFTLGAADMLRRAMGKKIAEEMAKQRSIFMQGAEEKGIDAEQAGSIFDLMEEFAKYGFNKSHSAAYALVAFQTAWFKAHYPAMFLAATLSADMAQTDKVVMLIAECRSMGLKILPPDINTSQYEFVAADEQTIVYGLGAIKGVGQSAIEEITRAREEHGEFTDLFDFCRTLDLRKVNRRTLETLIDAGALDKLGAHRAAYTANLANAISLSGQESHNRASGQDDMFGDTGSITEHVDWVDVAEHSENRRLELEKKHLGLYLTGHPLTQYRKELGQIVTSSLGDLNIGEGKQVTIAGLIVAMRTRTTRQGGRMAILTLDDQTAWLEIPIYTELYETYKPLLQEDRLVVITGKTGMDDYTGNLRVTADKIYDMDTARETFSAGLRITLRQPDLNVIENMKALLHTARGGSTPVVVDYANQDARARIHLPQEWCVHPSTKLLHELKVTPGVGHVACEYDRGIAGRNVLH